MPNAPVENEINLCRTLGRNGKGTVIVCAAQNWDSLTTTVFPAVLDDVIGVIASTEHDLRRTFGFNFGSNYGPLFDVAAPGSLLITTDLMGAAGFSNIDFSTCLGEPVLTNDYFYYSETSAATPVVSAAAAVIISADTSLTAGEVQFILENTADKVGFYNYNEVAPGKSLQMGYGRINLGSAIAQYTTVNEEHLTTDFKVYPNPTNDKTQIRFSLKKENTVTLTLYNSLGQAINILLEEEIYGSGQLQEIMLNTDKLAAGLYFIVLQSRNETASLPLIINK
jgi:subtilisin family serine protease